MEKVYKVVLSYLNEVDEIYINFIDDAFHYNINELNSDVFGLYVESFEIYDDCLTIFVYENFDLIFFKKK